MLKEGQKPPTTRRFLRLTRLLNCFEKPSGRHDRTLRSAEKGGRRLVLSRAADGHHGAGRGSSSQCAEDCKGATRGGGGRAARRERRLLLFPRNGRRSPPPQLCTSLEPVEERREDKKAEHVSHFGPRAPAMWPGSLSDPGRSSWWQLRSVTWLLGLPRTYLKMSGFTPN